MGRMARSGRKISGGRPSSVLRFEEVMGPGGTRVGRSCLGEGINGAPSVRRAEKILRGYVLRKCRWRQGQGIRQGVVGTGSRVPGGLSPSQQVA